MYAFLGFVPFDKAKRGEFDPVLVVSKSMNPAVEFVVRSAEDGSPVVVNDVADDISKRMITCMRRPVNLGLKLRKKDGITKRLNGLLLWYECDVYARPQGRVLLAAIVPDRDVTTIPEPTERLLSRRMGEVPAFEEVQVAKPVLSQITTRTEKQKEKKLNEELVC